MAGQASTVGSHIALDAMSGRATQTARNTYLALLTAAPDDATTLSTMTEVSDAGYTRQQVTWTAPSAESTENSGTLTFGPFSGDPATVTHCALVSAASGTTGDFIFWWSLTASKDPAANDSITFAAGALTMTLE